MKKYILIIFLFVICGSVSSQELVIWTDRAQMVYNNHVGNEWAFGLSINEDTYRIGVEVKVALKITTVVLIAQEQDKYPDTGSSEVVIDPGKLKRNVEYYKDVEILVIENRGRYSGNTAKWIIRLYYMLK